MRDPDRIDRILDKIRIVWLENPVQRLGQLLVNADAGFEHNTFRIKDTESRIPRWKQ